jgi:hypothetical protein
MRRSLPSVLISWRGSIRDAVAPGVGDVLQAEAVEIVAGVAGQTVCAMVLECTKPPV